MEAEACWAKKINNVKKDVHGTSSRATGRPVSNNNGKKSKRTEKKKLPAKEEPPIRSPSEV